MPTHDEVTRLRKENEALRVEVDAAQTAYHEARGVIVDLCWQFGDGGDRVWTKGLSALEGAFDFLGWPNPCPKDQAV